MRRKLQLIGFCFLAWVEAQAQQSCSNPYPVTICPSVYLPNQTNAAMGDDGPPPCNIAGEDVVYEIHVPDTAEQLFISIVNASAALQLFLETGTCGTGICSSMAVPAGNSNVTFVVGPSTYYYLWVDAGSTVTYDISFGADTGSVFINIPDTQGNLQFDSSGCSATLFAPSKPFFEVEYNSVFQYNPMTLAPLFLPGTMCISTYFRNTTGIESVKKFTFTFNPAGYATFIPVSDTIPGFYNAGNWIATSFANTWTFQFYDLSATGQGDHSALQDTCLRYEFCFLLTPVSNDPLMTSIDVKITSDGFGAGYSGFINTGCCPSPFPSCLFNAAANNSANANAFAYGFADPGGGPLPVVLLAFDAQQQGNHIAVNWITASEVNNDFFTVERTLHPNEWNLLSIVDGAGNSSSSRSYEFNDNAPLAGISYYRLKQTDFDGTYSYSEIKAVNLPDAETVTVFPNPASGEFTITLSAGIKNATIEIYDLIGEKIFSGSFSGLTKRMTLGAGAGIYFIKISDGKMEKAVKLFKE